jgi:hypothetical protein
MICTKHKVNNNANSGRTLPEWVVWENKSRKVESQNVKKNGYWLRIKIDLLFWPD